MDIERILKALEGIVEPSALKAVQSAVQDEVSKAEQDFKTVAEEKYGITPQTISDAAKVVEDAAPTAEKAVEDAIPTDANVVKELLNQLKALQDQVNVLKTQGAGTNQTTSVMGQGEPVNHILFLEDGTVVKNHAGLATHYSVDNGDGTDTVKRVISAYPTA